MTNKLLCGIDEAGRGPLAGSLVVAGVVLVNHVDGLMDSKKLSEKRREILYEEIILASKYHIVVFLAKDIDEMGISQCMIKALEEIQEHISDCDYMFDGNTSFGVLDIETMIKADTKIAEVSAASILAKVTHDRQMYEYANLYPKYSFERNKGYGTKAHREAIAKYGRCPVHRYSFKIKGFD